MNRALVCTIHEGDPTLEVCPCYSAAIAEDIRTTWSKIDRAPGCPWGAHSGGECGRRRRQESKPNERIPPCPVHDQQGQNVQNLLKRREQHR